MKPNPEDGLRQPAKEQAGETRMGQRGEPAGMAGIRAKASISVCSRATRSFRQAARLNCHRGATLIRLTAFAYVAGGSGGRRGLS